MTAARTMGDPAMVVAPVETSRHHPSARRTDDDPPLSRVVVGLCVLVGVVLRVVLATATSSFGRPDSDEVIAGLMARRIGTDGYPLFFWGQNYGGTPVLWLDAISLRLFGSSVVAMRVPTLLFAAGCSLLVWRVGKRLLPRRAAELAAVLSWIGAPPAVFFSTRDHLFYVPTVFFGLIAALCALRLRDEDRRRLIDWLGVVLGLGLGLWCMPTIVYFAVPALFVVGADQLRRRTSTTAEGVDTATSPRRHMTRRLGLILTSAVALVVVAAGAYLWFSREAPPAWRQADFHYGSSLVFFFTDGLPGLLGFREIFTYRWILGPVGIVAYIAVLALIAVGLAAAVRRRTWDAVGLLLFPFVFALFPKATEQPNMRYMFFLVPFLAVVVARVAGRRWTSYVAIGVALLLTMTSMQRLYVVSEVDRSTRVGLVGDVDAAIAVLDQEGVTGVYANYWIAYRITFESSERIIATPPFKEERQHAYAVDVARRDRVAWVVGKGEQLDALRESLAPLGVSSIERDAGDFVVVLTDRVVRPDELGDPARAVV